MNRERQRARRRSWPVLTVFACIVGLQLLVTVISIDLMSAIRAYVTGESLYSKGQKDAQLHLIDYAEHHREEDYQRFLSALAVPIGDRNCARGHAEARAGLRRGARAACSRAAATTDDIPGVIRLFRWFHKTPLMAEAIATWTEGDAIDRADAGACRAGRTRACAAGDLRARGHRLRAEAQSLNNLLTPLRSGSPTELGRRRPAQPAAAARPEPRPGRLARPQRASPSCATAPGSRPRPRTRCGAVASRCSACSTRPPKACTESTPRAAAPSSTARRSPCSATNGSRTCSVARWMR